MGHDESDVHHTRGGMSSFTCREPPAARAGWIRRSPITVQHDGRGPASGEGDVMVAEESRSLLLGAGRRQPRPPRCRWVSATIALRPSGIASISFKAAGRSTAARPCPATKSRGPGSPVAGSASAIVLPEANIARDSAPLPSSSMRSAISPINPTLAAGVAISPTQAACPRAGDRASRRPGSAGRTSTTRSTIAWTAIGRVVALADRGEAGPRPCRLVEPIGRAILLGRVDVGRNFSTIAGGPGAPRPGRCADSESSGLVHVVNVAHRAAIVPLQARRRAPARARSRIPRDRPIFLDGDRRRQHAHRLLGPLALSRQDDRILAVRHDPPAKPEAFGVGRDQGRAGSEAAELESARGLGLGGRSLGAVPRLDDLGPGDRPPLAVENDAGDRSERLQGIPAGGTVAVLPGTEWQNPVGDGPVPCRARRRRLRGTSSHPGDRLRGGTGRRPRPAQDPRGIAPDRSRSCRPSSCFRSGSPRPPANGRPREPPSRQDGRRAAPRARKVLDRDRLARTGSPSCPTRLAGFHRRTPAPPAASPPCPRHR